MTIGILYVWCDAKDSHKKYLEPILKRAGIKYAFLAYSKGNIPAFNINPEADVVLALGGNPAGSPLQELKSFGLIKKNLTLGSSRGTPYI